MYILHIYWTEQVRQLEEELASQKRATQAANNAAEAQKVALERANVVHTEELHMMQEETEQRPLSPIPVSRACGRPIVAPCCFLCYFVAVACMFTPQRLPQLVKLFCVVF